MIRDPILNRGLNRGRKRNDRRDDANGVSDIIFAENANGDILSDLGEAIAANIRQTD